MIDGLQLAGLLFGAGLAGFVNGFAGFGTALFASGVWFAILPFETVPPLIVINALIGQLVGLVRLRRSLAFNKAKQLIFWGVFGVPLGTLALIYLHPDLIKVAVALLLIGYAIWRLSAPKAAFLRSFKESHAGFAGGFLGGLTGLSGPIPIVWCQLQNLSALEQRARYQPFNFVILGLSCASMALFGIIDLQVAQLAALSAPATIAASLFGVWAFGRTSEADFTLWILRLLLLSGLAVIIQVLI